MSGKSIRSFSKEQFRVTKEWRDKVVHEMDSDEELKWELEKAVKNCKENKQVNESTSSKNMSNCRNQKVYSDVTNDPLKTEMNSGTERYSNGDALLDVVEVINYFFLPKKSQNYGHNHKSFCEYEKQGAIPKNKVKNDSKETNRITVKDLIGKIKSRRNSQSTPNETEVCPSHSVPIGQTLNPECDNEIVKVSEETCLKPFFYVVPEYPSPNFFLPRGSYYIIPKAPSPSTEESIVFHPERGSLSESKVELRGTSEIQSKCVQINNLGKDVLKKLDSHLNIGPGDVKLNEVTNNLNTNCSASKVYQKNFASAGNSQDSSTSLEERQFNLEVSDNGFEGDEASNASLDKEIKELESLMQNLRRDFPNWSLTRTSHIARKYLHNKPGLEKFLASERLECKIQDQFERLFTILPESDTSELLQKCREFKGNEDLLMAYIEEVQRADKFDQHVTELQLIFPDADPEFLRQEVTELGDDGEALSKIANRLLVTQSYPKISEDFLYIQRRRLWKSYVVNFNVKNYLRDVPRPERFAGVFSSSPDGDNNKADKSLVLKYLRSRYLGADLDLLEIFQRNNNNLTKTCDHLNLSETARPMGNSLENEPFYEEFLQEICYIEHKKEIDGLLNEIRELKEIEKEDARINGCFLGCPLCGDDELIGSDVVACPEAHVFCVECIRRYISVKIGEGVFKFVCPQCDCFFTSSTLESILPEKTLLNIAKKQQAEEISSADVDGLESCPHCEFAYIPTAGDKIFKCQNSACLKETCRKCLEENHIPLRCEEVERPADILARKRIEETMTSQLVRTCPSCKKEIVRVDGCNKMVCPCGTYFCYLCRSKITGYDHFNSVNSRCPLHSHNEKLHGEDVVAAGIRTMYEIIQENPDVRILYDPTKS